jgi:hypothetical protein
MRRIRRMLGQQRTANEQQRTATAESFGVRYVEAFPPHPQIAVPLQLLQRWLQQKLH